MSGILFFIFASCEPLNTMNIVYISKSLIIKGTETSLLVKKSLSLELGTIFGKIRCIPVMHGIPIAIKKVLLHDYGCT